MASSTPTPDNLPAGRDRRLGRGHGTEALEPIAEGRDIDADPVIEEGGFDAGALDAGELDAGDIEEGDRARPDLADNPRNAARTSSRKRR
jgi:hypothetical protein